jgi:hypothetical protein
MGYQREKMSEIGQGMAFLRTLTAGEGLEDEKLIVGGDGVLQVLAVVNQFFA